MTFAEGRSDPTSPKLTGSRFGEIDRMPSFATSTRDNLGDVIESGWITQDKLCAGVTARSVPACS